MKELSIKRFDKINNIINKQKAKKQVSLSDRDKTKAKIFEEISGNLANGIWSILKIIAFCLIIIYLWYVLNWAFETENGIMIQSFETNLGDNISGISIADLLSSELQDIANTNALMQNEPQLERINFYTINLPSLHSKSIETSLANIGSVSSGGSSLSFGQLSLSLKRLLHTQPDTIKGSMNKYGSTVCIVADIEESNSSSLEIWKVNRNLTDLNESLDQAIPYLVKDLAHQIALDLSKRANASEGELPQTWQAFECVNEGQREYLEYIYTGNVTHLYSAEENALDALNFEPKYESVRSLYYRIGYGFLNENKYNESERIFKKMMNDFKSSNASMALGFVYARQKEYQKASDAFNMTIKLKPDSYVAWCSKGTSLYDQGLYEKADLAYDRALYYNPTYALAWNNKGMILLNKGNYSEAVRAFSNATRYDDKFKSAWYNKGCALYCSGAYDQANDSFNKALGLNYSPSWNYIGLIWYNSSRKSNNYPLAIRAYDYYLSNDSGDEINNAIVWFNRGLAFYSWEKYEMAVDSFDEATWIFDKCMYVDIDALKNRTVCSSDKCPNNDAMQTWLDAWKYKGKALYKQKKYNQSIQANNTAIELDMIIEKASKSQSLLRFTDLHNNTTSAINMIFPHS